MGTKTVLKVLATATALALSGQVLAANTAADSTGTIFLNITDTNTGSSYIYDTGLSTLSFTGTSGYSISLAADPNFTAFTASENAGDVIQYAVVGAAGQAGQVPFQYINDSTASAAPGSTTKGKATFTAWQQINNFTSGIANPSPGSSFLSSAQALSSWTGSGDEANFNANLQLTDSALLGSSMSFYQIATNNPASTTIAAIQSTFLGTWLMTAGGALSYTVAAVPLPAPVLLLLSSLAMLGLIGRRRSSVVSGAVA
jgi:hypothetical protein